MASSALHSPYISLLGWSADAIMRRCCASSTCTAGGPCERSPGQLGGPGAPTGAHPRLCVQRGQLGVHIQRLRPHPGGLAAVQRGRRLRLQLCRGCCRGIIGHALRSPYVHRQLLLVQVRLWGAVRLGSRLYAWARCLCWRLASLRPSGFSHARRATAMQRLDPRQHPPRQYPWSDARSRLIALPLRQRCIPLPLL